MADEITDEFADADLKDRRRNARLPRVAAALAAFPSASISAATGGHAEMMAAYRLLNCEEVTAAALLAPHRQVTIDRCASHRQVVVSQDTTEPDFTHMTATEGLGPLNGEDRKGLYLHALYAVSADGLPLPCGSVFEEAGWKSACAVAKRDKAAGEPTLAEFIGIVGKLGGHLGRKNDAPPGPQSIWQSLARVRDFACAWRAFHGE